MLKLKYYARYEFLLKLMEKKNGSELMAPWHLDNCTLSLLTPDNYRDIDNQRVVRKMELIVAHFFAHFFPIFSPLLCELFHHKTS